MTDVIIILALVIVVSVLSGLITKCHECGKWFSLRKYQFHGHKEYICKHCGRKDQLTKEDSL